MAKIYLVVGDCGSYSDYSRWNVKGFTDKAKAEAFIEKLDAEVRRITPLDWEGRYAARNDPNEPYKKLDPEMKFYDDGSHYNIEEIEVEDR